MPPARVQLSSVAGLLTLLALTAWARPAQASPAQPPFHVDVPVGGQLVVHDWNRALDDDDRFALQPARYIHCAQEKGGNSTVFNVPVRCHATKTDALINASGGVVPLARTTSGDLWSVEVVTPAPPFLAATVRLRGPSGGYLKVIDPNKAWVSFSGTTETAQASEASLFRLYQGKVFGVHGPADEASIGYTPPGAQQGVSCGFMDLTAPAMTIPLTLVCGRKDYALSPLATATMKVHMAPPMLSINLAYLRPTSQSSNFGAGQGDSGRAVDGNVDGNYGRGSITHTAGQAQPWWQVDLGGPISIGQVLIHNRTDCCSDRLSNFVVSFSNDGVHFFGHIHHNGVAPPRLRLDTDQTARFVRVNLKGSGVLSLAEVQVFPKLEDLALGRQTFQSDTVFGGDAQRGVDGRIEGTWAAGSVTHTGNQVPNPYWRVELGANRYIDHVIVYNRTDCCGNRLDKARVKIRTQEGQEIEIGRLNAGVVQRLPAGMHGVAVTVQGDRLDYHSVAEVVVAGW